MGLLFVGVGGDDGRVDIEGDQLAVRTGCAGSPPMSRLARGCCQPRCTPGPWRWSAGSVVLRVYVSRSPWSCPQRVGGWTLVKPRSERAAVGEKWQDWEEWKQLLRLAEIEKDARIHDARCTAATLLLEQGIGMRVVQVILGQRPW